jgi:integrase
MILLAAYAGMSIGEIANVRGTDIDRFSMTIEIVGKGSKTPHRPPASSARRRRRHHARQRLVVPQLDRQPPRPARRPGPAQLDQLLHLPTHGGCEIPGTPDALRHGFGSSPVPTARTRWSSRNSWGHESMASTAIYLDVPLDQHSATISLLPDLREPMRRRR